MGGDIRRSVQLPRLCVWLLVLCGVLVGAWLAILGVGLTERTTVPSMVPTGLIVMASTTLLVVVCERNHARTQAALREARSEADLASLGIAQIENSLRHN